MEDKQEVEEAVKVDEMKEADETDQVENNASSLT